MAMGARGPVSDFSARAVSARAVLVCLTWAGRRRGGRRRRAAAGPLLERQRPDDEIAVGGGAEGVVGKGLPELVGDQVVGGHALAGDDDALRADQIGTDAIARPNAWPAREKTARTAGFPACARPTACSMVQLGIAGGLPGPAR